MFKNLNYIFSKRDKWVLLGLLLGIVIGSFFELVGVAIFSPFIQIIMDTDIVLENEYLNYFYVMFGFSSAYHYLAMIAGVIIAIYVFKNIFLAILKNYVYKFSYGTQKKISTRLLKAYMNEDYTFHLGKNVAILQRSMQEDTIQFTQMLIHTMELVAELTVCLAIGIYLLDVSVSITVAVVGLLVICVGAFTIVSKKYVKKLGRDCQTSRGFLFQWVNQSLGGIKEIKILGREDFFIDTYETAYSKFARDSKVNRLMSAIPKYIVETVCMSGLLIAVILKMFYGQKDDIVEFVPQLGVFAVAAFRLLPSVGKINEHVNNIFYALPSIEL
ncbi:MAG: ABC transporter transmembrane domain-containing protein, partial [Eubacteriales bacterium]